MVSVPVMETTNILPVQRLKPPIRNQSNVEPYGSSSGFWRVGEQRAISESQLRFNLTPVIIDAIFLILITGV